MKVSLRDIVRRHPEGGTISLVILISLAFAVITQGGWLSIGNLQSISQVTAVLAIVAFGEALVIATGEIDISVGSVSGIGALAFRPRADGGERSRRLSLRSYPGY